MSEFKEIPDIDEVPGNAKELSTLMETDPYLEEEILYLSGGVESFKNHNVRTRFPLSISIEEGGFDLQKIIERILKHLQSMVQDLFDGSTASALALARVHSRAEEILLDSRSRRRNPQKTDFTIDTRIQNLCVKYRKIDDPQTLLQHLKVLNTIVSDIYKYLSHGVYTCFEELVNFNPLTDNLDTLAATVINSSPAQLSNTGRFTNNGLNFSSPQLLGCQKVVIQNQRPEAAPLDRLLAINMSLENAEKEPREIPGSIRFNKFGISLEQSLIREVLSVLDTIDTYNTINRRATRRTRQNMIINRLALVRKQLDTLSLDETGLNNLRTYIRILEVYSGWMMSPYVGLIALTHRNLTAVLNVCEGNSK